MSVIRVPDRSEASEYAFGYIALVEGSDVRQFLEAQASEVLALLGGVGEDRSLHRYAPDKWSIRQVVNHMSDTERVFAFRALWFARGLGNELPGMDQDVAAAAAAADTQAWPHLLAEFESVRRSTVHLLMGLPDEAWDRRGIASGNAITVRALAFVMAGHVAHHLKILRDQYL